MDLHASPIGLGEAMASRLDKDVAASLLNLVDPNSQPVERHVAMAPYDPTAQNLRSLLSQQVSMPLVCPAAALTLALDSPSPQPHRPSSAYIRPDSSGQPTIEEGHSASSFDSGMRGSRGSPGLGSQRLSSKARPGKDTGNYGRGGDTDGGGGANSSPRGRLSMSNVTRIFTGLLDSSYPSTSVVPLPAPASLANRCDTGAVTQMLLKDACENWFFNIFELQVGCHKGAGVGGWGLGIGGWGL